MQFAAGLALILVAASPAQAAVAPGFCGDLHLLIQSVRETPTFASVTRVRPPPALAVFRQCRAIGQGFTQEVSCTLPLGSAAPAVEALATAAARCLPAARRRDDAQASAQGEAWLDVDVLIVKIGQDRSPAGATAARSTITLLIPEG